MTSTALADHLRTMRSDLVARMAADLDRGTEVHSWLPMLAQIHAALVAVQAVAEEGQGVTAHRAP